MKMTRLVSLAIIAALSLPSISMAMSADGYTGTRTISDGALGAVRLTRDGSLANQESHAKYQEPVMRGNVFTCSDLSGTAVTTKAGLDAAAPMLTLSNPAGSGKALVLIETAVDITASPAGAVGFSLAFNSVTSTAAPTTTTAATVQNANLGLTTTPSGNCYRVATLVGPPVAFRYIGGTTGASAIGGYTLNDNSDGKVIIPPGVTISIQTTAAAAGVGHFLWEEITYP